MDYPTKASGYGKRPLWQWILLYLIIGGAAYAAVYYVVFRKSGGYGYNANAPYSAPGQNQQAAPAPYQQGTYPSPSAGSANPPAGASSAQKTASFTVHANDASADLTTITVPKGSIVQIAFSVDAEGTYHGGLDFRSAVVSTGPISPGNSKTVRFTADHSFTFTPYWPSTNIQKPYTVSVVVQ